MPLDTLSDLQERTRCIEQVVSLLVAKRYREIEWLSCGVRLDATAIERAVSTYGRTLVEGTATGPGPDWVRIRDSSLLMWSVNVPLFTAEEGLSDLTLSLTLRQTDSGRYRVEIDDLHVL